MITRRSDKVGIFAAMHADERLDSGDPDGAAIWRGIIKAIETLTDCLLYTPITHKTVDCEKTKWQIDLNNSRWLCVCKADCGE